MQGYEKYIDNLTKTFSNILKGEKPALIELPPDFPDNEIKQLTTYFNKFIIQFNNFSDFTFRLSQGDLNVEPPIGNSRILQSVKSIQSDLNHLTWKTQRIAKGDYNQKVNFMGEFSNAFNSMTDQLRESKTSLEKKIEERTKELVKFKLCIDRSFEAILIADAEGQIIFINPAFEKMYGFSPGEAIGKTPRIIKSGYYSEDVYNFFWKTLLSKEAAAGEIINKTKDGKLITVEGFNTAILDPEGEITGYIGIHRDITERKKAEESVLKLSRAVEQSPTSVMITDRNGIIEYINPKLTEVTGYKKEEVLGKNPRIFSSGKKSKSDYKILWENIQSEKEWKGEFHNRKKSGELFWEYAHISPIINSIGEITHFVAIKEDITERKKMIEELILAKEKAEESDRLKSAFLANMSHEIRTPMNGILGFTSLLLEPDLSDETKDAYIHIIHQSGERMLNTVTDIVEISKIEAGIVDVKNSLVNVSEVLESILDFFQPQAQKKGLTLAFENENQNIKLSTNTDKNKLESILTNLIKNAIKFTDKGKITVSNCIKNGFIEFCIKDTGIGIPKHRQGAIFNRFEQADIEDTRVFEGSGLGLAIVKSYIEMLGGKIWVYSVEGVGSQFYFNLPYSPEKKESVLNSALENRKELNFLGQLKILIVEDDETSALFLETILKDFVQNIIYAKSGEQAIEECKTNDDFDLILMDIKMPGISGYETTRQIRQFNKEAIIIAQTAFGLSVDKEKAINAGCNDYISKPINKEKLKELIQKYFKL